MSDADAIYAKLKSAPPSMVAEVLDFVEFLEARAKAKPVSRVVMAGLEAVFGRLDGEPIAEGDPVDVQRKLRDEWA